MERKIRSRSYFELAAILLIVSTVALLLMAGCTHRAKEPGSPTLSPISANDYVGSDACAECHPDEAAKWRLSRHASTLHALTPDLTDELKPPLGPVPFTQVNIRQQGNDYICTRTGHEDRTLPLQLAFGSGKTGVTYVGVLDANSLYEMRMSYFPHWHKWFINPSPGPMEPRLPGRLHQGEEARHCLNCHSVTTPAGSLQPEARFYGVGCESCHGQGRAHIAAVRAGQLTNIAMERIGSRGATEINELCARCHRGPNQVGSDTVGLSVTNRFQPYGLMLSRCFLESHDTLSCLTCHDPHTDASTDLKHYEQVCLTCHPGSRPDTRQANTSKVIGKSCPVNPKQSCIGCHMPTRKVFAELDIPTRMADHYIRARPQAP